MNLSSCALIKSALATSTADTTTVTGATIDTSGYEGVLFIAKYGTAAANNTLHAESGAASDMSDAADLASTSVGAGASDEIQWIDLFRPAERYVRVMADRGTSSTLDWGVALLYGPKKLPVDNTTAGTIHGEVHASPAEGTK